MPKNETQVRTEFALKFIQYDLSKLRAKEGTIELRKWILQVLGLAEGRNLFSITFPNPDVYIVFGTGNVVGYPDPDIGLSLWNYSIADYRRLQKKGMKLLRDHELIFGNADNAKMASERSFEGFEYLIRDSKKTKIKLHVRHIPFKGLRVPCMVGSASDVFLFLFSLLLGSTNDFLLRCKDVKCGTVFLQVDKRSEFCSRRCANRATFRKWYERKSIKKRYEIGHQKYARRMKKKTGQDVERRKFKATKKKQTKS